MSQLVNPILFRLKKIFYWNVLYNTNVLDFKTISFRDIALYNLLLWLISNWRTEFADLYINSIRIIRYYKKTNIYLIFKHIGYYKKRRRYRRKKRYKFSRNGRLIFFKNKNKKFMAQRHVNRKKKFFNIKTPGERRGYLKNRFTQKNLSNKTIKKKRIYNSDTVRCRKWLKFKSRLYKKKKKKFIIDKLLRKKLFYASARKNKEYNIVQAYVMKIKLFFNMLRARLGINFKFPKSITVRSNEKKRYLLSSSFAQFIFVCKKREIYRDRNFHLHIREDILPEPPSNKIILLKSTLLFLNLYDKKSARKLLYTKNRIATINKLVFLNKFYLYKSTSKKIFYSINLINKMITLLISKIKSIAPYLKINNFKIKKMFKKRISFFKEDKKKDLYAIYEPFVRKPYNMLTYGVRDIVNAYSFGRPPKRYWFFRKVKILGTDILPVPPLFKKKKFTLEPLNKMALFIFNFYYDNINKKIYFKSRPRTHRGWERRDINLFKNFSNFIRYIKINYYKRSLIKKDKYYSLAKNFFKIKKKKIHKKFIPIKYDIYYKYRRFFLLCKRLGVGKKKIFKIFKSYYGFKLPTGIKKFTFKKYYNIKKKKSLFLKNFSFSKVSRTKSSKIKHTKKLIKYKKESWRRWFLTIKKIKKNGGFISKIPRHSFFSYVLSKYLAINRQFSFYIRRKAKLYNSLKVSPYFNIYKKNFFKFKRRRKLRLLPVLLTYLNFFNRDYWFDLKKKKILLSRIRILKLWKKKFNYTIYKPKIAHITFRSFLLNYLKVYKKAFVKVKNPVNTKKKFFLTFIKNPTYYLEYTKTNKIARWTSMLFYLNLGDVRARNIRELFKRNKTRHLKYLSERIFFKNIFNRFIIKSIKKQKLLRSLRIIEKNKLPLRRKKISKILLPNNFRRYLGLFHSKILSSYYNTNKKIKLKNKTYKNKLYKINRINIKKFFKFFYSAEIVYIYKLKNLFYKYLYKFFKKANSSLELHIIINHMSHSVPTSQFVVDAMLVKLFQKFRINIILKFLLKTLSKYIDSGELDGVRVVTTGRFSRRDRSTYKIIKKGSVPLNSRLSPIDYAIGSIALRYSICVCRVWLAFKNK